MHDTARKRLSSITVLSLLSLLGIAVGAQVALAVASSSTPAAGTQGRGGVSATSSTTFAATPTAGTQGRGGIAAASVALVATTSPAAGTEGRGGIAATPSSALAALDPAAGTAGRGGVAGLATTAGETTVANSGFSLRARGGAPRPVSGRVAPPSPTSAADGFVVWVAVGVAVAALLLILAAWISTRRRRPQTAASRAAFCAQHPDDAMCQTA